MSDQKKLAASDKKLPELDDNSVEEIPGDVFDDVVGGMPECNCSVVCTSTKPSKAVQ